MLYDILGVQPAGCVSPAKKERFRINSGLKPWRSWDLPPTLPSNITSPNSAPPAPQTLGGGGPPPRPPRVPKKEGEGGLGTAQRRAAALGAALAASSGPLRPCCPQPPPPSLRPSPPSAPSQAASQHRGAGGTGPEPDGPQPPTSLQRRAAGPAGPLSPLPLPPPPSRPRPRSAVPTLSHAGAPPAPRRRSDFLFLPPAGRAATCRPPGGPRGSAAPVERGRGHTETGTGHPRLYPTALHAGCDGRSPSRTGPAEDLQPPPPPSERGFWFFLALYRCVSSPTATGRPQCCRGRPAESAPAPASRGRQRPGSADPRALISAGEEK